MVLEENPDIKKEIDSAKFFQVTMIKILEKVIDEHVQQFYQNKEIEKEIMLLIDRLRDSQKNAEDVQRFNENISKLNQLQAEERARMFVMLATMQALNERYTFLEIEKQKSIKAFTDDMLKTLDQVDIKKDNGQSFTQPEKVSVNNALAAAEIRLVEQFVEREENKVEGRNLNQLIRPQGNNIGGMQPQARNDNVASLFLPSYKQQDKGAGDTLSRVLNSIEFKQAHLATVKDVLKSHGAKDPQQAEALASKRVDVMKKNPKLNEVVEFNKKQKAVKKMELQLVKERKKNQKNEIELDDLLNLDLEVVKKDVSKSKIK